MVLCQGKGRHTYCWLLLDGLDGMTEQRRGQVLVPASAGMCVRDAAIALLEADGASEAVGCRDESP